MRYSVLLLATAALLSSCGAPTDGGDTQSISETAQQITPPATDAARAAEGGAEKAGQPGQPVTVSIPQLAYAYKLGFLVPSDKLASAQDDHRTLCENMGPARCQLLAMDRGVSQDEHSQATLKLRVVTSEARAFQNSLNTTVTHYGGRALEANVAAADVSKAIIDTQARIEQRTLLVARLTEMLRTRSGKIEELIEAERRIAEAQEELDKAKGWLTELKGRVAMSTFEITYGTIAPTASSNGVGGQLGEATQDSAATFMIGLRSLLTLAIYLIPWLLFAAPVVLAIRWFRRRVIAAAVRPATPSLPLGDG